MFSRPDAGVNPFTGNKKGAGNHRFCEVIAGPSYVASLFVVCC